MRPSTLHEISMKQADMFAACFMLVSCMAYSSTLKTDAVMFH
jgi:hypothetical protein